MVTPEFFLRLYTYNDWANEAVLDAAEKLSPADYTRDFGQSWRSVRGILTHIMAADHVWLTRWLGESPVGLDHDEEATPTVAALRNAWQVVMQERRAYLHTLQAADLIAPCQYRNTKDTPYSQPLWELLTHVVNHGTDHRGHVSTTLAELGSPTVPLDLIAWVRDNPG